MANDVLMDISRKVGAAATAGVTAPVVVAREAVADALKPVIQAVNPMTYARMAVQELDRVTGLGRMVDAYKKIYGFLSTKDSDVETIRNPLEDLKDQSAKQVKLLDLILDVLMQQYDLAKLAESYDRKVDSLEKFREIERAREQIKVKEPEKVQAIKEDNTLMKLAMLFMRLPKWLMGALGVAGVGSVGALATYLGFDKVVATWKIVKDSFGSLGRAIASSGDELIKLIERVSTSKVFAPVTNAITKVYGYVKSTASLIGRWFPKFKGVLSVVGKISASIGRFAKFLGGPFLLAIIGLANFIEGFVKGYKEEGVFEGVKEGIKEIFRGFVTEPLDLLKNILSWMSEKIGLESFSDLLDSFSFTEQFNKLSDATERAVEKIGSAILNIDFSETVDKLVVAIKTTIDEKLVKPIVNLADEIGLTKLLDVSNLLKSVEDVRASVRNFIDSFDFRESIGTISMMTLKVAGMLASFNPFPELVSKVESLLESMTDKLDLRKLVDGAMSFVSDVSSRMSSIFDFDSALGEFKLPNVVKEVAERVNEFIEKTLNYIKGLFTFDSLKSLIWGEETSATQSPETPPIVTAPNSAVEKVIREGASVPTTRSMAPVYFDNKQYIQQTTGGTSTGNGSRNVRVNSEASRSRWERRQGGVSGW